MVSLRRYEIMILLTEEFNDSELKIGYSIMQKFKKI
jgi:hypothetical protein